MSQPKLIFDFKALASGKSSARMGWAYEGDKYEEDALVLTLDELDGLIAKAQEAREEIISKEAEHRAHKRIQSLEELASKLNSDPSYKVVLTYQLTTLEFSLRFKAGAEWRIPLDDKHWGVFSEARRIEQEHPITPDMRLKS